MTSPDPSLTKKKKSGCLLWAVMGFALVIISVGGLVWYSYNWFIDQCEAVSSPVAVVVPTSHEATLDDVYSKIDAAREMLDPADVEAGKADPPEGAGLEGADREGAGTGVVRVDLSVDELNTLIAEDPEAKRQQLPGRVRVLSIDQGNVEAQITWPLDNLIGSDRLNGRHINALVGVSISVDRDVVAVEVSKAKVVDGDDFPEKLRNLIGKAISRHATRALQENGVSIEEFSAELGKLTVRAKRVGS